MNPKDVSVTPTGMRFGVISALLMIVYSLLLYVLDLSMENSLTWIAYIFLWGGLVFGIKTHSEKDLGGYMKYGRGLGIGMFITLIAALINGLYTYAFFAWLDPDMVTLILEQTEENMIDQGQSEAEIEMAMKYTKMMVTPGWMAIWGVLFCGLAGLLGSLVVAAIFQKSGAPAESTQPQEQEQA